ncbi:glycosyltransferase [Arenibacter sp. 6A1]|nr:glycosyltransferase [Arenibacter sp. 6A1]
MDKARKRIFMINQTDESHRFGVGRYISEMVSEAQKRKNALEMVVVTIGAPGVQAPIMKAEGNMQYLDIPKPFVAREQTIKGLSRQFSLAVFCIMADLFDFSENDIFHFNNNMQYFLLKEIKENTSAKIIYTIHVSLWKVFYKNDKNKFLSLWKEPDETSTNILNIRAEKKNCMLADSVICLTNSMAQDVKDFYEVTNHKIKVVPNGIDAGKAQDDQKGISVLAQKMATQTNEFVFLFVGRLNDQKGVKELVEAFISVSLSVDVPLTLIVVGEGYLHKTLDDMAKKSGASIFFTGYVEPGEIHKYYGMANGIVFPSSNEQSSYVMLEAMKYKVPLIVTNIPAFEVLRHGSSCLKTELVDEKVNMDSLVKNMSRLALDPSLVERVAQNAFELFKENYSSENMFIGTYGDLFTKEQ